MLSNFSPDGWRQLNILLSLSHNYTHTHTHTHRLSVLASRHLLPCLKLLWTGEEKLNCCDKLKHNKREFLWESEERVGEEREERWKEGDGGGERRQLGCRWVPTLCILPDNDGGRVEEEEEEEEGETVRENSGGKAKKKKKGWSAWRKCVCAADRGGEESEG